MVRNNDFSQQMVGRLKSPCARDTSLLPLPTVKSQPKQHRPIYVRSETVNPLDTNEGKYFQTLVRAEVFWTGLPEYRGLKQQG